MATPFTLGPSAASATATSLPELLGRVLEWPTIVPGADPPFYVSIHNFKAPAPGQPRGQPPGRPCFTPADAASAIAYGVRNRRDVYFCTATLKSYETRISKQGLPYRVTDKHANNVHSRKCLACDVDAVYKGYATTREAVRALFVACHTIGFPRPSIIVLSGSGGVHAYWPFTYAIPAERWSPLAGKLATALDATGLQYDRQVTVDAVRILRVPGSHNYKGWHKDQSAPKDVVQLHPTGPDHDVADLERILAPVQATIRTTVPADMRPFAAGADPAFQRSAANPNAIHVEPAQLQCTIEDVAAVCPFIAHTLATGGAGLSEPLWKETVNIAVHINSEEAAHRLSRGHAGYSKEETDAKFAQQFHVKLRPGGLGWTACTRIASAQCPTCEHWSAGKSPLNFAVRRQAMATVAASPFLLGATQSTDDDLPPNFRRSDQGITFIAPDGVVVPVCSFSMFDAVIIQHVDGSRSLSFTARRPGRDLVPLVLSCELTAPDVQGLFARMARVGLGIDDREKKLLRRFLVAWLNRLQEIGRVTHECRPLGWHEGGGFVTADTLYGKGAPVKVHVPESSDLEWYRPRGDLAQWQAMVQATILDMHDPAHNLMLAAAFASPLATLIDSYEALWLSVWGPPGRGKSTTLKVANSVWASPRAIQKPPFTQNALFERMGRLRNYPFAVDDLIPSEKTIREVVMQLIAGSSKARLDVNVQLREVKRWCNLTTSSSNYSLIDTVTDAADHSAAQVLRIFEYVMPERQQAGARFFDEHVLDQHYGVAGERYAQWLGANEKLAQGLVLKKYESFGQTFRFEERERFWRRIMATLYVGAWLASRLQLVPFTQHDLASMQAFLGDTLDQLRGTRQETKIDLTIEAAVDYLVQFIHLHQRSHTVAIRDDGMLVEPEMVTRFSGIFVEQRSTRYLVSWTAFRKWLRDTERAHSARQVLKELSRYNVRLTQARLADLPNVATYRTAKIEVLEFDPRIQAFGGRL